MTFQVFYLVEKQIYKLKPCFRLQIHNVFYISPLKQDIRKTEYVNKLVKLKPDFDKGEDKDYKIKP